MSIKNSVNCFNLINNNVYDSEYFKKLGWSENQYRLQFLKKINLGLGLFKNNKLQGFILGDLINIEKEIEYEILLIYVNKDNRKLGYASMLLNEIPVYFREKILNKIYLEVASSNLSALNLYKKNEFQKTGYRKEYYLINDKRIDAYFFEKKINE